MHSHHSGDGHGEPRDIVLAAQKAGLAAIAVTDHNTLRGAREVQQAAKGRDLIIVPGMEVSSNNGHIIALGVTHPIPRDLAASETIRRIDDQGGLAVASHPGRFYTGLSVHEVRASSFPAIEVANGHSSPRNNQEARKLAEDIGTGMTGGSDAHWPEDIGRCRTVFKTPPTSVEELLEAIRDRETDGVGEGLSFADHTSLNSAMMMRWMKRGGKRI